MEPEEYAIELYYKFTTYAPLHSDNKKCALIAVDEILKAGKDVDEFADNYWLQVKTEIEKL
jgi:hypothetical protein